MGVLQEAGIVEKLATARTRLERQELARGVVELRPPHVFLNKQQNVLLYILYGPELTYEEVLLTRGEYDSVRQIIAAETAMLQQLEHYLTRQPWAYYQPTKPGPNVA